MDEIQNRQLGLVRGMDVTPEPASLLVLSTGLIGSQNWCGANARVIKFGYSRFRKSSFPRASLIAAISAKSDGAFFFDLLDFWPQELCNFHPVDAFYPGSAESGRPNP